MLLAMQAETLAQFSGIKFDPLNPAVIELNGYAARNRFAFVPYTLFHGPNQAIDARLHGSIRSVEITGQINKLAFGYATTRYPLQIVLDAQTVVPRGTRRIFPMDHYHEVLAGIPEERRLETGLSFVLHANTSHGGYWESLSGRILIVRAAEFLTDQAEWVDVGMDG